MLVYVKVKPGHAERKVESFGGNRYLIYTEAKEEKAVNDEVLYILSKRLATPVGRLQIKSGLSSNDKVIEVS